MILIASLLVLFVLLPIVIVGLWQQHKEIQESEHHNDPLSEPTWQGWHDE